MIFNYYCLRLELRGGCDEKDRAVRILMGLLGIKRCFIYRRLKQLYFTRRSDLFRHVNKMGVVHILLERFVYVMC